MGTLDVVDAELASDLVVITASAFEGAEAQAEGETAPRPHTDKPFSALHLHHRGERQCLHCLGKQ
jgi:hypothetical protein